MQINVSDSAEFKRLLEALVDDLIDARDYFRLHQDLDAAIPDYQNEFNQSPAFWAFTFTAHMDAAILRLCKAYDLYERKPSLNLRNFLETIEANLHFFDELSFRERLKGNPFVDSLAADPRKPDLAQLQSDLRSVGDADPLVKKLTFWRHNFFAHRSRSSVLSSRDFVGRNPLLFSEIKALIENGLRIVNHYSSLFTASVHTSMRIDDYKNLLDAVRRDLKRRKPEFQRAARAAREDSA